MVFFKAFFLKSNDNSVLDFESLCFLGFVATLPFPVRYNSLFIVALGVSWIVNKRYVQAFRLLKNSMIFQAIVVFVFLMACSLLYTENRKVGLEALEAKLYLLFLPILLGGLEISVRLRNLAVRTFIYSMVVASLYSVVSTISYYKIDFTDWSYFSWVITDTLGLSSTHYAMYIVFALLFCIIGYFEWRLIHPIVTIFSCLYLLVFLALISSRMPIALFVVSITLYAGMYTVRAHGRLRWLLISFVLTIYATVGILSLTVPYLRDRIKQVVESTEPDPRYFITTASFQIIRDNWMLGVGLGDVQSSLNQQYRLIEFKEGLENEYNTHNDWTNVLLIGGVPAFIALLVVFLGCIKLAIKHPDPFKWIYLVVYVIAMQTETFFNRNKGVLLFTFLLVLFFLNRSFIQQVGKNDHV